MTGPLLELNVWSKQGLDELLDRYKAYAVGFPGVDQKFKETWPIVLKWIKIGMTLYPLRIDCFGNNSKFLVYLFEVQKRNS